MCQAMWKPTLDPANDLLSLQNLLFQHWLEVEDENETQDQMQLDVATLIIGLNEDHAWAIENRHPVLMAVPWTFSSSPQSSAQNPLEAPL